MNRSDRYLTKISQLLRGRTEEVNLKSLRKKGVKDVHVITRQDFEAMIKQLAEDEHHNQNVKVEKTPLQKRIELLLIEIEALRREKSGLEHQKGLLETERAELQGRLDEIANAGTKAFGEKVTIDTIRTILRERAEFEEEARSLRSQNDIARQSYEEQITELRVKVSGLESQRDDLSANVTDRCADIERLKQDLETSRNLASKNAARVLQLEEELAEAKDSADKQVEELKLALEAKDKELDELKNPPEEAEPETSSKRSTHRFRRGEAAPAPSSGSNTRARPATRRMSRRRPTTRRSKDTGRLGNFEFSGGTSRAQTRRRRSP